MNIEDSFWYSSILGLDFIYTLDTENGLLKLELRHSWDKFITSSPVWERTITSMAEFHELEDELSDLSGAYANLKQDVGLLFEEVLESVPDEVDELRSDYYRNL
jgi:hypothetical protein